MAYAFTRYLFKQLDGAQSLLSQAFPQGGIFSQAVKWTARELTPQLKDPTQLY